MTREEIINRKNQIDEEIQSLDLAGNSTRSKVWKHFKELCNENSKLQRELDKLDGKTYDCEKWITKFIGNSYESLKAARLDLIKQIKNLHGVEIDESNTGCTGVTVYTEYKIYHFVIHAHYRVEKLNVRMVEDKFFGGMREEYDTKQIYQAWVSKEESYNWSWRY